MSVRESVFQWDQLSTILQSRNIAGDLHNLPTAALQLALRKREASNDYTLKHEKETKKPQPVGKKPAGRLKW